MAFQRKAGGNRRESGLPGFVAPALATSVDRIPAGGRWIHEIKFDGYRVQVHLVNEAIKVFTRRGHDWPHPPLSSGLSQIRWRAFGATSLCSGRWNTILTRTSTCSMRAFQSRDGGIQ